MSLKSEIKLSRS